MKKSKFISVLDVEKELCIWYMMLIQNLNKNNIFNIRNKNKSKTKTTQFSYLPRHYSPRIIQQISVTCPARLLKLSLSPEPDSDGACSDQKKKTANYNSC